MAQLGPAVGTALAVRPPAGPAYGSVQVAGHCFALTEDAFPAGETDVAATGLAAAVPGGVVVRTATADGWVHVRVEVAEREPQDDGFVEEVVDLSYRAERGFASVLGAGGVPGEGLRHVTAPRAGDYRVRVQADGRDTAAVDGEESYWLTVWPAPAAPALVHRRTDRLGHRLRGEPEAAWPHRPELAYAWLGASELSTAATVIVVTGSTLPAVLRAFEVGLEEPAGEPEVQRVLAGLPLRHGRKPPVGMLAVERFTGRGITPGDLARIEAADVAYRLTPPD